MKLLSPYVSLQVHPQNGFSFMCPNQLPIEGALDIPKQIMRHMKEIDGITSILAVEVHPPTSIWETSNSDKIGTQIDRFELFGKSTVNTDRYWPRHCISGEFGSKLLPGLPHPSYYHMIIAMGQYNDMHSYSAMYHDLLKMVHTGLGAHIKHLLPDGGTIIVSGLAIDYCVKETVIDVCDW